MVLDFLTHPWFTIASRIIVGGILYFSGFIKLFDLKGFSRVVMSYNIFPRITSKLAYALPFAEFAAGLALLTNYQLFWAAILAILLQFSATGMVVWALLKRKKMKNCGCYGVAIKIPLSWNKVGENAFFILLAVQILIAIA